MKNQFFRMLIYCSLLLILLFFNQLNFFKLVLFYSAFVLLEVYFTAKGWHSKNKYIIYAYRALFIVTGIIVIFSRENIMVK